MSEVETVDSKPRVNFCWVCSKKLRIRKFTYLITVDGLQRIVHKICGERYPNE